MYVFTSHTREKKNIDLQQLEWEVVGNPRRSTVTALVSLSFWVRHRTPEEIVVSL